MSLKLLEQRIKRFLSTKEPEVICITGRWGVGKTFAWNRYLRQAAGSIELPRYSYVSLFGLTSLEQLKFSVFENTVNPSSADIEPSLETLRTNTTAAAARFGRKATWFLQELPFVKDYVGGLGPLWFSSVRETIRLRTLIYVALRFSDSPDPDREISQRAREALLRIGQESSLNNLRVARFGRQA